MHHGHTNEQAVVPSLRSSEEMDRTIIGTAVRCTGSSESSGRETKPLGMGKWQQGWGVVEVVSGLKTEAQVGRKHREAF